ncbi:MAG: STAS domain-containing protein [Dehalococcoidia bacterium]|nr:STAS domain-containing protein [Dehalococcoidia bacterium]
MSIKSERRDGILVVALEGRLGAFEAARMGKELEALIREDDHYLVLDMSGALYLSSGGIRLLLSTHKKLAGRKGHLSLCGITEFPAQVLKMAGMEGMFPAYTTVEEAVKHTSLLKDMKRSEKDWRNLPCYHRNNTSFYVFHVTDRPAVLKTVGDLAKVMNATLEPQDIRQRRFSEAEYSIGLGALGGSLEDCLPLLGEMMTSGGIMVWLPTDGNDTPDFLIPQKDTGEVLIHTGLNLALHGEFNDIMLIGDDAGDRPISLSELYEAVFDIARERQAINSSLISLAMIADLDVLFSSGVRISPIKKHAPANRGLITDPENINTWMDINLEPKLPGRTMISFGIGLDLTADVSHLSKAALENAFYMHPANAGSKKMMLHNHGMVFENMQWESTLDLDEEIRRIARAGEFVDMRHLLDTTRIKRAVAGVSYISDIKPE